VQKPKSTTSNPNPNPNPKIVLSVNENTKLSQMSWCLEDIVGK
jgi:hypothetical protein